MNHLCSFVFYFFVGFVILAILIGLSLGFAWLVVTYPMSIGVVLLVFVCWCIGRSVVF